MVNEWKSDAVLALKDRFCAEPFDPNRWPHVRQAVEFFGGEHFPDIELAVRRILTILLSAGVTEVQISEADEDVVAESALALYAATARETLSGNARSRWEADPSLIPDLREFNNLVFPNVSSLAVQKSLIIDCLRELKVNLRRLENDHLDIVSDQPDLTDVQYPFIEIHKYTHQFRPMIADLRNNIEYRTRRLAQLRYSVPDELINIRVTDGTRFDKENNRLAYDDEQIELYGKLANELNVRQWRLEHEAPSAAPALTSLTGPKISKASVNARMFEVIQSSKHPACTGWTAEQWRIHLDCSKTAVIESRAWQSLKVVKADERLSRGRPNDRRRRKKSK